jgi:hypothetical protein
MQRTFVMAACSIVLMVIPRGVSPAQQLSVTAQAGGSGGIPFVDPTPPIGVRALEVRIRSGDQVDSVQMVYEFPDHRTAVAAAHGGGGGKIDVFRLGPDEYIVGISGRSGQGVDSLRIHTNRRTSPLFGSGGGERDFRLEVPIGNQVLGFSGRAGDGLDAIGLIYASRNWGLPAASPKDAGQGPVTSIQGGSGGASFADRGLPAGARISAIRLRSAEHIDSVQAIYTLSDGRQMEGARHGGGGGGEVIFQLESEEYVVGLSGRSGEYVDSLRILTNRRTSQTFGGQGGRRDFRVDVPEGTRALGFAGRAGEYLDAIGLTYEGLAAEPSRRPFRPSRRP